MILLFSFEVSGYARRGGFVVRRIDGVVEWLRTHGPRSAAYLDPLRRALQTRDELTEELAAMRWLVDLNTRLVATTERAQLFAEVLYATIAMQEADSGYLQLYDAETQTLEVVAQRDVTTEYLELLRELGSTGLSCGKALSLRRRVIVEDIEADTAYAAFREVAGRCGIRAAQSTPLVNGSNELLGMITTHFRRVHSPSERQLRLTDLYARQVAEWIDRERAERERNKLAALVENSTDFIGIASLEGHTQFVNATGRRLLGDAENGIRPSILDYVHEDDRSRFAQEFLPAVERDGRWEGEVQLLDVKTGAPVPMLQHIFYIQEPTTGQRIAMATICRDNSERKRAEEALRAAQDELTHAGRLSSMGELIASIAHEVSQPLAAIVTNGHASLHWLAHERPNLGEARAAIQRILDDGERATEVVRRLRSLAMKRIPQETRLDVRELVQEMLALTQRELASHRVHVRLDLASTRALLGDRVQLQQVLLNLIVNAIAAMAQVGDRARELAISTRDHGADELLISVCDTGTGVRPEQLDRMFEPFYTTKPAGLGLGLSISQRIIAAHGGGISATLNDDHGLTLTILLPAQVD